MRLLQFLYLGSLATALVACSEPEAASAPPATSGSASVAATVGSSAVTPPAPLAPAKPGEKVSFNTADGVTLTGELWAGSSPKAPLLVLVHRYRGDRSEWKPLIARLQRDLPGSFRTLSFDLRGHEESRKQPDGKELYWGAFEQKELPSLAQDVRAALEHGRKGAEPGFSVLVGSSLGATLASMAAKDDPQVRGLALVCPGGGIERIDIYRPFAAFATALPRRPVLLMAGKGDNVSRGAVGTLHEMARQAKLHEYESRQHSAQFLGQHRPELWDDLASWLKGVRSRPLGDSAANPIPAGSAAAPAAPSASSK